MKDYREILRRVGRILIVTGVIDILHAVYCFATGRNILFSFNILLIISGFFILKGSLKAVRIVSWLLAFLIAFSFGSVIIVMPFRFPFDLLITFIKLEPIRSLTSFVFIPAVTIILLIWMYRELRSQAVLTALDEAEINYTSFWRKPSRGFWIGSFLILLSFVAIFFLMRGSTAGQVKQRATSQIGEEYKFCIKSLNISYGPKGKNIHAVVIAYNDNEIKNAVVEWLE